jgi:hypothetical protein
MQMALGVAVELDWLTYRAATILACGLQVASTALLKGNTPYMPINPIWQLDRLCDFVLNSVPLLSICHQISI